MTLPSIIEGTQAHYETQRRLSEQAYAQTAGVPRGESLLQRLMRRLSGTAVRKASRIEPARADVIKRNRPPVFSK